MVSQSPAAPRIATVSATPLHPDSTPPNHPRQFNQRLRDCCLAVPYFLLRCHRTAKQRRELSELDECFLADIGLTKQDALIESRRGWFDLPPRR